ncbi:hypothetical protein [Alcanivorax quisquiliarum]|uniref:Uncharacterized protein n=1 Tax=Alcanivorax quisquiliarum TaxID=2933565 RepID=A0ABT0E4G0_9GAMM|nr:hypothetical protein [Alcanivorax quisquiliarum]MCK0536681.1 hypothetical protein [Alcanivorax quisquiliarum]
MSAQKYSVNQHLIETLLSWVKSGEIAIPALNTSSVNAPAIYVYAQQAAFSQKDLELKQRF